jgi:hypothetical protein
MAKDDKNRPARENLFHMAAPMPPEHVPAQSAVCEFGESGSVTVAALLNLLRLVGSELVLSQSGCETERFEQAVRAKIGQFLSPTTNENARAVGLLRARQLVEHVMAQIRAQAQLQKSLRVTAPDIVKPEPPALSLPLRRQLN